MKASWEVIEKNQGVLTIEVEEEKVAEALDAAFKKVVKTVNVPGFRKGKLPRQIFEAKFGVESLYQDAIDIILPTAYVEALDITEISPVAQPEIDIEQFEKGQPMKFTAKVTVKPEVELGKYKGLEVEAADASVSEEELNNELEQLQQRQAELIVLEEGTAENGDTVIIDFEGFVDGEAFEGGQADNYSLELGSDSFIPGFEEQLVGISKDEEKEVEVTFPQEYHAEQLAGKAATFKVKVHDIKRKVLPELDDEFAKDVSEFETLDEYKADLTKQIEERKQKEYESERETKLIEAAANNATVEIPSVMFDAEQDRMLSDFENRLRMQGMTLDIYYQYANRTEEELRAEMREDAEKRVLNSLVLEAISKAEKLEVNEEDVTAELEKMAGMYQMNVDDVRENLEKNGMLSELNEDLVIRKAVQFLVEHSKEV